MRRPWQRELPEQLQKSGRTGQKDSGVVPSADTAGRSRVGAGPAWSVEWGRGAPCETYRHGVDRGHEWGVLALHRG